MAQAILEQTAGNETGNDELGMLRDAIHGTLSREWPALNAAERGADPAAVRAINGILCEMGFGLLGTDPAMGGVAGMLLVQDELGRAACPAPILAIAVANLLLGDVAAENPAVAALLAEAQQGAATLALAFGAEDGDRTAGGLAEHDGMVSGELRYLDAAAGVTMVIGAVSDTRIAIVTALEEGATIATRAMGGPGLGTVRLDRAAATFVDLPAGAIADAALLYRVGVAQRALGAAGRGFELIVEYAKERRQFGKAIGSFQAIQHKLANNYIALEATRRVLAGVGEQYDRGVAAWRFAANGALSYAGTALRQVSMETHHAFGAIGYAEDHEAPRHFKRVHQDLLRFAAGRRSREALAKHFLDDGKKFPDFDLGESGNAFREEVRDWLRVHWTPEQRLAYEANHGPMAYDMDFSRELGKTGWLGLSWPKKFGGQHRSAMEHLAFLQAMGSAEVPRYGSQVQAVAWMLYGRPEQQAKYLPPLLAGEDNYGMFYSEPNSGSDLASLQTRAVRDGDEYVINGQKIWTTSYYAKYMWLAARTDPDAKPQNAGISMFCVPTDTPGFTRTAVANMYDGEFANSFFDDMRVPADCLVGELNQGWEILMGSLSEERGGAGAIIGFGGATLFEQVCTHIRGIDTLRNDPVLRDAIGRIAAELEVARYLALLCFEATEVTGDTPLPLAAAAKVFAGELLERMCETLLEHVGMEGALSRGAEGATFDGKLEQKLRHSMMYVISMGTNEIQRNVIAIRGLGLPR